MKIVDRELGDPLFGDLGDELALTGPQNVRRALPGLGILGVAAAELECELDLAAVHVLDGKRSQLPVLQDVHSGPVGDSRHGHLRDGGERGAIVERAAERRTRLDEKPLGLLRALLIVDVGVRAEPLHDRALTVAHRQSARQVPAVRQVRGALEAELVLVGLARCERVLPVLESVGEVLGMYAVHPAGLDELGERQLEVVERALVHVVELAVRERGPDLVGLRLREEPVPLFALAANLRELLVFQELRLALQLLGLLVQLDEDRNLRAQDVRVERLEDVVDSAGLVPAEDMLVVLRDRRHEDDRDVPRALALLDQRRGFEAVQDRHLHVEQDHRDVLVEELAQSVLAGVGVEELLAERLEDRLEREQVLGPVVDEEDLGQSGLRRFAHRRPTFTQSP